MSKRANGEGSIFYREDRQRWCATFTIGRDSNGKLIRKNVYGKTRKEALQKKDEIFIKVKTNTYNEKSDTTLIEIIDDYINNQFHSNRISTASYTRKKYTRNIIEKLPISYMKIQEINIDNINFSLQQITNYSDSVLSKVFGLISTGFDIAVLNKIINQNPFKITGAILKPHSIKETKEIESLTIDEEKIFLEYLDKYQEPYRTILYIATFTGMRVGEILALHEDDIHDNFISVTKTLTRDKNDNYILGKTTKTYSGKREVPLIPKLRIILDNYQYKHKNGYYFILRKKFINPTLINAHFKRICKNAGIKVVIKQDSHLKKNGEYKKITSSTVNTHMLRHTFATRAIENGMSAVALSRILGHKDISTTLNTYTSVFNKFKSDEMEKIDKFYSALLSN